MEINNLLDNADENQISDLWGVFIEKTREIVKAKAYMDGLEFSHEYPESPDIVTLESLTDYILAQREYNIAKKSYQQTLAKAEQYFNNKLNAIQEYVLIFDEWIAVDDSCVMFKKASTKWNGAGNLISDDPFRIIIAPLADTLSQIKKDKEVSYE